MKRTLTLATLLTLVIRHSSFLLAQGPLTPPGAPGPTMKTLDQVEARTPIDTAHTPGNASNLFIISQAGSYYLTGNLTGMSGKSGILISASGVTLDLNGFELLGVTGSLDGIRSSGVITNIAILNGSVRAWGGGGIILTAGGQANTGRFHDFQPFAKISHSHVKNILLRDFPMRADTIPSTQLEGGLKFLAAVYKHALIPAAPTGCRAIGRGADVAPAVS